MSQGYAAQAVTRMCTKDTVKTTGLNIWVSGEDSQNRPEVEYALFHEAQAASLTSVRVSSQFKVSVPIHITHGSGIQSLLRT